MRLLLGPHDLQAPNQPPSSVTALTGLGQPFPLLLLRKSGDYSPSKAWKRSLCSTLRRGGAHRSRGGARSQRADLGTGEMQVRGDWEKRHRPMYSLTPSSQPLPFHPGLCGKVQGEGSPKSQPASTPRSLLHKDSCFSPLGLSDISLFSYFNLPNPPGLRLSCVLPPQVQLLARAGALRTNRYPIPSPGLRAPPPSPCSTHPGPFSPKPVTI